MKKHLTILLFLPLALMAQDRPGLAAALIPKTLSENANAVIRNERVQVEVASANRATVEVERTVTLLNGESRYNEIKIYYDKFNKLGKIKGRTYDANGNMVRELHKREIRDQSATHGSTMYSDNRVRYIIVENSDYPFTVEFEYSKTYKDILGYPDWMVEEFGVGVEKAELSITLPKDFGLYHEVQNLEVVPEIKNHGDRQQYIWSIGHLPPVKKEPYSPPVFEILPVIQVSAGTFEAEGYTGSMSTWQDFGLFMNKLTEGRGELSPNMKKTVREMTAGATSDQEKIDTLYRYLQKNMRYVSVQLGIGGWQPFSAGYVESNKFGDCKALSNFMMAMLTEAGIESCPVLIHSGDLYYEIHDGFAYDAFNHVILHVPSENYWLECTSSSTPPNYLGAGTDGRNVLLVTKEGGVVARTPALTPDRSTEQNDLTITLQKTGQADLKMSSVRTGEKQEYYRSALTYVSQEEMEERYQEYVQLSGFDLEKLEVLSEADRPEVSLNIEGAAARFAAKAGKRLFVPLNPLNAFTNIPPGNDARLHPIVRPRGYTETDHITIALPEGYEVESLPAENTAIESEHARYSCKVTAGEGSVTVERRLEVLPCRLPAAEYGAWREVYKQIAKADAAKLVLVEKKT